jgi:hypothetical protein
MDIEDSEEEKRWLQKWRGIYFWSAIVLAFLLIVETSYSWYQSDSYNSSYNSLYKDYSNLIGTINYQNGQISVLQRELENMLQTYDQRSYVFNPPSANASLNVWGRQQTISPYSWIEWSLLDTFVNHLDISSNATATYVIVDPANFVQLFDNVSLHQNTAYTPLVEYTGTHFVRIERLSQGSSGYMLVVINHTSHSILLAPKVTATYAPTSFLTGTCSLAP